MSRPFSLFATIMLLALLTGCAATAPQKESTATFYPPLPAQPRLQYLTSITSEDDLGKKASAFRELIVGKEMSIKQIARGHDLGSVKGKLYISDRTHKRILIVDLEKNEFGSIEDQRLGALKDPFGLHVTDDGFKYVADSGRKQVVVFGPDEAFVRAYGETGQFEKPMDVALFGERLYVVDLDRHAVLVVDKESGQTVQTIGEHGTAAGKFDRPTHIRIDRQGNLFVNDSVNFRIQKFDPKGKYLKEFGYLGIGLGGFARPKGLDVSADGKLLYVADAAFENVQIFDDESTNLLLYFGGFGNFPGSLYIPSAVYIDDKNVEYFQRYADQDFKLNSLVIVSNMLGPKKLNVYGFGDWIGEKLPEMAPQSETPTKPEKSEAPAKPDAAQ